MIEERIKVSCLANAAQHVVDWRATHVVSLLDPSLAKSKRPCFSEAIHYTTLFYDQENDASTVHFSRVVDRVREFIDQALRTPGARLLIHCHAGASRSTAFALGAICMDSPGLPAATAMQILLSICRKPWPNRRITEELDSALDYRGTLLFELDAYRSQHPKRLAAYRILNKRRGLISPVVR